MKIGRITKVTTQGVVESTIEVDAWKVLTGLISAGLVTGLIAGLTFLLIDLPKNSQERKQNLKKDKLEVFNFVLRAKSDTIRKESLIFLLKSDVLSDDGGKLQKLIDRDIIPNWSGLPDFKPKVEGSRGVPIKKGSELKSPSAGIQ